MKELVKLASWLYVYDEFEYALQVCEIVQDIPNMGDYTLWDQIDIIWCIKARILREQGFQKASKEIIVFVNQYRDPKLYTNLVAWFNDTLEDNIHVAIEVTKSKSSEILWRMFKMNQAIWFREAGNCPIDNGTLDRIISEQKEILSKPELFMTL